MDLWNLSITNLNNKTATSPFLQSCSNLGFQGLLSQGRPNSFYPGLAGCMPVVYFPALHNPQTTNTPVHSKESYVGSILELIAENELLKKQLVLQGEMRPSPPENEKTSEPMVKVFEEDHQKSLDASEKSELVERSSKKAKTKRCRRLAKEIQRVCRCPVSYCHKAYGTEGALHHHIRLKHYDFDFVTWLKSKSATSESEEKGAKLLDKMDK